LTLAGNSLVNGEREGGYGWDRFVLAREGMESDNAPVVVLSFYAFCSPTPRKDVK
jgi:hypothetical protein